MRRLRFGYRLIAILLYTVTSLVLLIAAWISSFGHQPTRRRMQHGIFRWWSRRFLRLLNVEVEIIGDVPGHGALLVSNHLSYVDIPLIAHVLPPRFVAKAELRSWPLVGWCCRGVETIFVDRASRLDTSRVAAEIRAGLERGDNVVLFPEGTSGPGHDLMPFRPSLLAPPAAADLPVHYSALKYETAPDQPPAFMAISWWGDMPFAPHAKQLLMLDSFRAKIHFGDSPVHHSDRKVLAQHLRELILAIFEPTVDFEPESPENPRPRSQKVEAAS